VKLNIKEKEDKNKIKADNKKRALSKTKMCHST
jgi:hypothetical protein